MSNPYSIFRYVCDRMYFILLNFLVMGALCSCEMSVDNILKKIVFWKNTSEFNILRASAGSVDDRVFVRGYNKNPREEDVEILDFNPYEGAYSLSTNMGYPGSSLSKEEKRYIQSSQKSPVRGKEFHQEEKENVMRKKLKDQEKTGSQMSNHKPATTTNILNAKLGEIPSQFNKIFSLDSSKVASSNDEKKSKKSFKEHKNVDSIVDTVKGWVNKVPGVNTFIGTPQKKQLKGLDQLKRKSVPNLSPSSRLVTPADFKHALDKGHMKKILNMRIAPQNYHGRYYKGIAHYMSSLRRLNSPDVRYLHARSAQKYLRDLQGEKDCPEEILIKSHLWFGIISYRCFHSAKDVREGLSSLLWVVRKNPETRYCNDAHFYTMLIHAKKGNRKKALRALQRMQEVSKDTDLIYNEDYKVWSTCSAVARFYSKYLEKL